MHEKNTLLILLAIVLGSIGCRWNQSSKANDQYFMEAGKEISSATFMALSTQLRSAMEKGGVSEAVKYCNIAAYPITDSLASLHAVDIKRATDRPRNKANNATPEEWAMLEQYRTLLRSGGQLTPQVVMEHGKKKFYAPIVINDLCLKCHGDRASIADYRTIADLYPQDDATGYAAGDLRGVWSITFRSYREDGK